MHNIFSLTISNVTIDAVGRLNHTGLTWETSSLDMNMTVDQIRGGFDNLTDSFLNDLLNLSGPELLELAWPGLKPGIEEGVGQVC